MAVNLDVFTPIESVTHEIRAVDGVTGTGWFVDILSSAHPKAQAFSTAQAERNIRREAALLAQQQNGRKIKPEERTVDETRRENVAFVVSRLGGWTPITVPDLGPGEIEFSDAAAAKLLAMPKYGWVYLQLLEFLNDERNFTKGSAVN